MIVPRKFYQKPTLEVAQNLLGCFLVRKIGRKIIKGIITETEAYIGEDDLACHASRGRTPRTEIMYGEAGHLYVYMIYGMYFCMNIITEKKNFPAAVLLRAAKFEEIDYQRTCGPGKLCRFLKIDKKLHGIDITKKDKLWIEKGINITQSDIIKSRRVGIDYAKHCREYLWRFQIDPGK